MCDSHEFEEYNGENICFNCGLIGGPILINTYDYSRYRTRPKSDRSIHFKKCIKLHAEQCNCSVTWDDVSRDYELFMWVFNESFPNESMISVKYRLYRMLQFRGHCNRPEEDFIKVKLQKTKDRYIRLCDEIFSKITEFDLLNKTYKGNFTKIRQVYSLFHPNQNSQ